MGFLKMFISLVGFLQNKSRKIILTNKKKEKKMKKVSLVLLSLVLSTMFLSAQLADDLFISEYMEGSSNNKAIEIFNGTGAPVDLSGYQIERCNNGAVWDGSNVYTFAPGEWIIADGDVWVNANSSAMAGMQAVADSIGGGLTWYNGNDSVGLFKTDGAGGWTLIDVIGENGVDPGSAWDVAGTTGATGEHTLVRKSTVTGGNTDWASSAGTTEGNSEWIVYSQDTFIYLGSHTMGDDTIPPTIFDVLAYNETTITVTFSEELEEVSAETESNYTIVSRDVIVENAELNNDNPILVTLTVSGMTEGDYTLIVNGVEDLSGNAISASSTDFDYVAPPETGDVVINEIGEPYDMDGTWHDSYIELYNNTEDDIDISGWIVHSIEASRGTSSFTFPEGTTIAAYGYIIATRERASFLADYGTYVDEAIVPTASATTGSGVYIKNGYYFSLETNTGITLESTSSTVYWNSEVYERAYADSAANNDDNWYLTSQSEPVQGTPGSENSTFPVNDIVLPKVYLCNYPNPFNSSTTISFNLATNAHENTQIEIYNIKGQLVKEWEISSDEFGVNQVVWNVENQSSGIYFYKLKVNGRYQSTQKMILLK